jgi:hypothetical protein
MLTLNSRSCSHVIHFHQLAENGLIVVVVPLVELVEAKVIAAQALRIEDIQYGRRMVDDELRALRCKLVLLTEVDLGNIPSSLDVLASCPV